MRLEDYQRKVFEEVGGFWSRGQMDQIPEDHFSDALNIDYDSGEWKSRDGLNTSITLGYGAGNGKVRRFQAINDTTIGPLILILDDAGNLYTFSGRAGDTATTPRLTVGGATDFSAIKLLGHIYIAFHDGQFGLTGQNLKIFIPHPTTPASDVFRDAAGLAPAAGSPIVAATSAAAGIVNAGVYHIAVAYITTSGFITPPGPKIASVFTFTAYTAPGAKKIDLSNIPTGPAGTAQRQILITKAGLLEFFFVSSAAGGIIPNNTGTTTTINFDDTVDLVDSADYLFDELETIPAPLTLQDYNARLCIGGEAANSSIARVSRPGDPESFDSVDGIVFINKDDGFTIKNMCVVRRSLYVFKNLGVFVTDDNQDVPSSWDVTPVDKSINVGCHGVAKFFDISGVTMARDWTLVADRSGILLFDGVFRKQPVTFKVNNVWQTLNESQYHKIVLTVDERFQKIYCAFPTGSSTDNNYLLMGDYNLCPGNVPESNGIKWSPWEFRPGGSVKTPTTIGIFGYPPEVIPRFKIGSIDGGGFIWRLDPTKTQDVATDFPTMWRTALWYFNPGYIHFFTAARLRILGTGNVASQIAGEDAAQVQTTPNIPLPLAGSERLIRFNFTNEKAALKFLLTCGKMIVSKIEFFGIPQYQMRPSENVTPTTCDFNITSGCPLIVPTIGTPFSFQFTATGGTAPYSWEVVSGAIPPSFSLDRVTGILSTPSVTAADLGHWNLHVRATDSGNPPQIQDITCTLGCIPIVDTTFSTDFSGLGSATLIQNHPWEILFSDASLCEPNNDGTIRTLNGVVIVANQLKLSLSGAAGSATQMRCLVSPIRNWSSQMYYKNQFVQSKLVADSSASGANVYRGGLGLMVGQQNYPAGGGGLGGYYLEVRGDLGQMQLYRGCGGGGTGTGTVQLTSNIAMAIGDVIRMELTIQAGVSNTIKIYQNGTLVSTYVDTDPNRPGLGTGGVNGSPGGLPGYVMAYQGSNIYFQTWDDFSAGPL